MISVRCAFESYPDQYGRFGAVQSVIISIPRSLQRTVNKYLDDVVSDGTEEAGIRFCMIAFGITALGR